MYSGSQPPTKQALSDICRALENGISASVKVRSTAGSVYSQTGCSILSGSFGRREIVSFWDMMIKIQLHILILKTTKQQQTNARVEEPIETIGRKQNKKKWKMNEN